jgi:MYXO-CTERM domain-containing protein
MKTFSLILASLGTAASIAAGANAAVYYSTNFGTGYVNGNLAGLTQDTAGQNGWKQTGTSATTPVQVANGAAIVGSSGQDVYRAFDSTATATAGTTLYVSASIKVTAAQATGDYFLFVGDPAGTTTNFFGRLYAKSTTGGMLLGIQSTSGTSSAVTYGTTVLNLNQTYNVVYAFDFASGALNDTFTMYIDPTSTNRASLTSYASAGWLTTSTAEPSQLTEIGLRQGTAASAPTVSVYSLAAGSSLADVGVVPAPGALALLGVAGLVGARRRR